MAAAAAAAAEDEIEVEAAAEEAAEEETEESEYERGMKRLVELLSKLNPSAKEFFPSSHGGKPGPDRQLSPDAPIYVATNDNYYRNYLIFDASGNRDLSSNGQQNRRRRNGYNQGRRRTNDHRARRAEREDSIRRTVYVSDIDHNVTEEKLAEIFASCGQVVDCRVCGDPHSVLRFAFVEFSDEDGARAALSLGGTMLGYYPLRVLPSRTAILPVNPKFLPQSEDEKEMVVRTVYCTNIDKKATQTDVQAFFEEYCGEVSRLRLLGDNVHSTRIAFVEFVDAESAIVALNCSGMLLGALPVRVSPSKTPVRPRVPRATSH